MQARQEHLSTQAVIILLVSTPTLIAVAFWSIMNPALAFVFLTIAGCFARPFQQYLGKVFEPSEK